MSTPEQPECPNCGATTVITWPSWPGLCGCPQCVWRWRPPHLGPSPEYAPVRAREVCCGNAPGGMACDDCPAQDVPSGDPRSRSWFAESEREALHAKVEQLTTERDDARADAGELVAIKALVSDRDEAGCYAKVEALMERAEALALRVTRVIDDMREDARIVQKWADECKEGDPLTGPANDLRAIAATLRGSADELSAALKEEA